MGKTVEERAEEYQNEKFSRFYGDLIPCYKEDYIKIATEQKAIDIDKACKWLSENLDKYVGEGGWNIWDDDPNCENYADIVARDFRKAMED